MTLIWRRARVLACVEKRTNLRTIDETVRYESVLFPKYQKHYSKYCVYDEITYTDRAYNSDNLGKFNIHYLLLRTAIYVLWMVRTSHD